MYAQDKTEKEKLAEENKRMEQETRQVERERQELLRLHAEKAKADAEIQEKIGQVCGADACAGLRGCASSFVCVCVCVCTRLPRSFRNILGETHIAPRERARLRKGTGTAPAFQACD